MPPTNLGTEDTILTTTQVAAVFKVHPATVAKWADDGKVPHFLTPGGQRRYRRADIEAFIRSPDDRAEGSPTAACG